MISGRTKLTGFFAKPASHSLSPLMHNLAFSHWGIDAVYLAFEVDQTNLRQAVESIRTLNMLGVNVSMPNKTAVLAYLDQLSPEAELIGAVNTIVHQEQRLIGYNTDGMGFVRSVNETGHPIKNQKIVVLGAGGAAKAIVVQMALEGAQEITIYKRLNATFLPLKEYFAKVSEKTGCPIRLHDYADESQLALDLSQANLLINATDIGMGSKKDQLPIADVKLLHSQLAVFDLIYSPSETRLIQEAKKMGIKAYNGLGMLIHQGAIAFELWTHREMAVQNIRERLEQEV
ncbi:shikimate dehydrogenase [Enterococcus hirae]|uniref:Shikimate dehydrogenase (NADP(+)) n=1 Tax=Enterococcus hirae TaxID=1354 RepID=A0AB37ICF2_ENTHR|nr:shikimate dehydrogenase [Enterococcus hirae]EMF0484525.1 shikimate dehydrogenase [Enterococcus hirae]PCE04246.1 shikimate dehydrogenase [Enterococcus hirae]RBT42918.1 shikimate 5-dehydrogenase [Enterococcus hirae]RBT48860.1 shikimate 5-dehydrogenase [Enterococcus hirae]RBT54054.1 shikimate 5-dehydrogenase [Enterococcus hirae]